MVQVEPFHEPLHLIDVEFLEFARIPRRVDLTVLDELQDRTRGVPSSLGNLRSGQVLRLILAGIQPVLEGLSDGSQALPDHFNLEFEFAVA